MGLIQSMESTSSRNPRKKKKENGIKNDLKWPSPICQIQTKILLKNKI